MGAGRKRRSRKFELNAALEASGATVSEAELSPISISLKYDFPRQEETEAGIDENGKEFAHMTMKEPPYFTGVRMKDGTMYTAISNGGMGGYAGDNSDVYEYAASFKRTIDVEQIESLLFIRSYPEGEQPLTEENLYIIPVKNSMKRAGVSRRIPVFFGSAHYYGSLWNR